MWTKGSKHTQESRQKMSKSLKGRKAWNDGLTKDTDIRLAKSGKKSGASRKGMHPWNYGLRGVQKQSIEEKRHRSEYAKAHGFGKWMIGKTTPPETKEKLRIAANKPQNLIIARRNGVNTSEKLRSGIETSLERDVRLILEKNKIPYIAQKRLYDITICDFFINPNGVIYADGVRWHSTPSKMGNDKGIRNYLRKCGMKVLVITDVELKKDKKMATEKIISFYQDIVRPI